jgi:hypothetical protein
LQSFGTGLLYLGLGCASAYVARGYGLGTAANMGAGYFPFAIGCLLTLIGGYLTLKGLIAAPEKEEKEDGEGGRGSLKIIVLILASVLAFALLIPKFGFLVAVASLIFVAGLASGELSWKEMAMLVVILTGLSTLVFVVGLGLSFQILPSFITG